METKIKIDFKNDKGIKILKYNKKNIMIQKIITNDIIIAMGKSLILLYDTFVDEEKYKITYYSILKNVFRLLVLQYCTNIEIDGIQLDSLIIDNKLYNKIIKNIENIKYVENNIMSMIDKYIQYDYKKDIQLTIMNCFKTLNDNLPNVKTLTKDLSGALESFSKMPNDKLSLFLNASKENFKPILDKANKDKKEKDDNKEIISKS